MYTTKNYPTKKALKEAVAAHQAGNGPAVTYFQPGPFGGNEPQNGTIYVEGPRPVHKFYAQCEVEGGKIVKVK